MSFNKFKSTTVYGSFQNSDIDTSNNSNAGAIFDRNVLIKGTLQAIDCSFNTIKLNGNITSNSLTITPIEISYLKDASSNIQTQINSIKTQSNLSTLILTGASRDASLNALVLQNNLYVNGPNMIVKFNNSFLNVGQLLFSLSTNYTTTTDLYNNFASKNYLDGVLINYVSNSSLSTQLSSYATSSQLSTLQTQANATTLLLSNTQYINGFGLNWYGSVNIFGQFILTTGTNNYIDAKSIIIGLPTTYVSITSLSSQLSSYVTSSSLTSTLSNYALISSLSSYVTSSSLTSTLSNYVTNSSLSSQLLNYTNNTDLSNNYVKNTTLSNYVTNTSLSSQLSSYVTNSSLASQLLNYTTTTDLNNNFASYTLIGNVIDSFETSLLLYTTTSDLNANFPSMSYLNALMNNYTTTNNLNANFATINSISSFVTNSYVNTKLSEYTLTSELNNNFLKIVDASNNYVKTQTLNNYVSQNKINPTSTFNQINSTIVYGTFKNMNVDASNVAYAYFEKDVVVNGILANNYGLFNTINITQSLIAGGQILSPTEISYLKSLTSNIQSQFDNITNNYSTKSSVDTKLLLYDTITSVNNKLTSYDTITSVNNKLTSYDTITSVNNKLTSYTTTSSLNNNFLKIIDASNNYLKIGDASNIYARYDVLSQFAINVDTRFISLDGIYASLSYVNGQFISSANNFLLKSDASNNYLKIIDASNNYIKSITLSNYVTNTSLTSTLDLYITSTTLTSNYTNNTNLNTTYLPRNDLLSTLTTSIVQAETLDVRSTDSRVRIYSNTGVLNGTISAGSSYFNITASGNSTLGVRLQGGPVIVGSGYKARQGQGGTAIGNTLNQWWAGGGVLQAWVDGTMVGAFTLCDYRIKENIQPASNVLDRLCGINMFNYEIKDIGIFKKNGTQIGFFAHELKDAFSELNNIVDGEKDALTEDGEIQPQTINAEFTHLLMKAIQELNLKVIELSNRIIELENKI